LRTQVFLPMITAITEAEGSPESLEQELAGLINGWLPGDPIHCMGSATVPDTLLLSERARPWR
jgi:hypothetical protein